MKEKDTFCNKFPKIMTRDEAYNAVLEAKYARIIEAISELHSVSLDESVNIFYHSPLLPLLEEGVGDLHCRSGNMARIERLSLSNLYTVLAGVSSVNF